MLTAPSFTVPALIGIAVPLFLVTMAGQNVPGAAVLATFGYEPPLRAALVTTGLVSAAAAPFGGHAVNLAAITAALTAGPEAHPDPDRRWIATLALGAGQLILGLGAGLATALVLLSPPVLGGRRGRPRAATGARLGVGGRAHRTRGARGGGHHVRGDGVRPVAARCRVGVLGAGGRGPRAPAAQGAAYPALIQPADRRSIRAIWSDRDSLTRRARSFVSGLRPSFATASTHSTALCW